jgi:superfamily II DNA or RNA helicase
VAVVRDVGPVPCVKLYSESVSMNRGSAFAPEYADARLPVLRLNFAYSGVELRSNAAGAHLFVADGNAVAALARDFEAETRARRLLEAFGAVELGCLETYEREDDSEADYLVRVDGDVHAFCSFSAYVIPQLRSLGFHVEIDDDYDYHVVDGNVPWYATVTPESGEDDGDWFGLELGVEIGGDRINLLPFLLDLVENASEATSFKALARTSNHFMAIPTGDGRYLPVPPERLKLLLKVLQELYQGGGAGRGIRVHEFQCDALAELGEALGEADFLRIQNADGDDVRDVSGVIARVRVEPPAGLEATLRPYQVEGLDWLQRLREHGAGGILADDMGLGKTLQTIAHIVIEKESGRLTSPALVVAPKSLSGNWQRELERFAPGLRVVVLQGASRHARWAEVARADVVVTSYPVLARDLETAKAHEFHLLILDEAQTIKNSRSLVHRACLELVARHRLCLSGTPIENNLGELWALFDFLMPGLLGDAASFRVRFRTPIEQGGNQERLEILRGKLRPFILRRTKEAVLSELPPKTEMVRPVELTGAQRDLYESIRVAAHAEVRRAIRKKGFGSSTIAILDALMKLRQVCCDPRLVNFEVAREVRESAKYELCMSLVEQQLAQGRRILLFSQFTSMLALISRGLAERGVGHVALTGETQNRQALVDAFERGEVSVFLISLKAGGVGLNLVSADTVIHYDPWWNPAAQTQATDRAHRIGQKRPVFVHKLIVAGSVEERMLRLQQRKQLLADSLLGPSATRGADFSWAEVENLLSPLT